MRLKRPVRVGIIWLETGRIVWAKFRRPRVDPTNADTAKQVLILPTSVAPECRLPHDLAGSDIPYFLNSIGQLMFPILGR